MILQQNIWIFPLIHSILCIDVNITKSSVLRWKVVSLVHRLNKLYAYPVTSLYWNSSASLDQSKPILKHTDLMTRSVSEKVQNEYCNCRASSTGKHLTTCTTDVQISSQRKKSLHTLVWILSWVLIWIFKPIRDCIFFFFFNLVWHTAIMKKKDQEIR